MEHYHFPSVEKIDMNETLKLNIFKINRARTVWRNLSFFQIKREIFERFDENLLKLYFICLREN